ncbi:MAG: hypothetical protein A2X22_07040 [Bacteroidetes bacterium GWF2_49_14]|nr:MAG: hypothetical protein A2X22_07040 [Bacteroidetes bacterium GWF2_49_14]HBB91119.1 hypothetical protein [Bacteroidales bacterium]
MPNADIYFESLEAWKPELEKIRKIILSCDLQEELKWGTPMYTFLGSNIIGIHGFKQHFALWFNNGVFLSDPYKLLISAGEKTKSLRQIRLKTMEELKAIEKIISEYIHEAIEVEKAGLKIKPDINALLTLPEELQSKLDADQLLAAAFRAITPGRRKEYAEYIAEAKQPETREKRLVKIIPMILQGIGLNDKYKNC